MNAFPRRSALAFALLAAWSCHRAETAVPVFSNAPVVVISIDTLRADRLPAYGYERGRTPNIDRLRADGVLFRNAYSHVPLTLPSHLSMLTGLLPAGHGVRDNIGYRYAAAGASLPQTLEKHGYATGAAVSAYVLRGSTGIGPLFDSYDDGVAFSAGADLGSLQRPGEATAAAARKWIAAHEASPFFFLLHLFEPHAPYEPPEPYRSAAPTAYDGEVAHADAIVGAFLDDLRTRGIYDRALVIILSDHGEGLGDHGENEHGILLYRETIHVPLIVKLPKNARAGETIDTPVGLVDVFPTVAALVGVPAPNGLAGTALLGSTAATPGSSRRIFSETLYPRLHFGWSDLRSLIDDRHHYIDSPRAELYSLANDPGERKNVLDSERRAAASFRAELERFDRKITAPAAAVSAEEAAKLAALGYVSAPATTGASGALPDPKDVIGQYTEYNEAKTAMERGDVERAVAGYERVLAQNPGFADAALGLARAYEAARRYDDAIAVYRRTLERNPALLEQAAVGMATSFLNAGRLADARKHAELALVSNPAAAHMLLARIALAAHAPADAERHAREATRDPHYEAQAVLLLSETLLAKGPEGAAGALQVLDELKARRARDGAAPVRGLEVARASALMRMSRTADATAALEEETRAFPAARDAYARLAAIHLLERHDAAAAAVLEKMVRANPAPASYALAADTLSHFGRRDEAAVWRARAAQAASRR